MARISNGVSGFVSPISGVPRIPSSKRARNSSRGRCRFCPSTPPRPSCDGFGSGVDRVAGAA